MIGRSADWDWIRAATLVAACALTAFTILGSNVIAARQATSPITPPGDESIYANGLAPGWQDWSWAPHKLQSKAFAHNGSASIEMNPAGYNGVYLHCAGLKTNGFTSLWFWVNGGSAGGQQVVVCCVDKSGKFGPKIDIGSALPQKRISAQLWSLAIVPLSKLNASGTTITGVSFQEGAGRTQPAVYFADIKLTGRASIPPAPYTITIDTSLERRPISPFIYGMDSAPADYLQDLRLGSNRWGGNPTTRYNWEKGNCFNTARDYEFRNTNYNANKPENRTPSAQADGFIAGNRANGAATVLTIPTIGFVAKDDNPGSRSLNVPAKGGLPVSAGNGSIAGYDPAENRLRTCIRSFPRKRAPFNFPPDLNDDAVFQDEWVYHLVQKFGTAANGGVRFYAMDNEPDLWAGTHTDIHPAAMGYDDLLSTFLEYATAVKAVDPTAQITGPVSWGWTGYIHSPQDCVKADFNARPDRRSHGDMEFIPWFLDQVRKHDARTGKRTLDVLDVHFYPQAAGVFSGASDPATQARRIRSTRALWDGGYSDESWIAQPVRLVPRMKEWISRYYPGTRLAITEWNWGADNTGPGGVAVAECLGVFGREGVYLANYWMMPPRNSPGYYAFKIYRNADGHGAGIGDTSVRATVSAPNDISCFAGLDGASGQPSAILINKQAARDSIVTVNLRHSAPMSKASIWRAGPIGHGITALPDINLEGGKMRITLPGYSVSLLRFH